MVFVAVILLLGRTLVEAGRLMGASVRSAEPQKPYIIDDFRGIPLTFRTTLSVTTVQHDAF